MATSASVSSTPVLVETTAARCFASALDWPGWSRSGKTPDAAVTALADITDRYRSVATRAGLSFPRGVSLDVVETLPGTNTTSFGAPDAVGEYDRRAVSSGEAAGHRALLEAAWDLLDELATTAPETLRKGARGGGRDRDAVILHVRGAQQAYCNKLGLRPPWPHQDDMAGHAELRARVLDIIGTASDGGPLRDGGWPARYAARRLTWHVLDHVWEIEDRSE